jgi:class 3 adenylate cyclase
MRYKALDPPQCEHCKEPATLQRADQSRRHAQFILSRYLSMDNYHPTARQLNRTFIGSVLFIDIVGYSCRTVPDQLAIKSLFNELLSEAVQNVAAGERIMVDTGDGAGIAFLGDPEDALFSALSLKDAIDAGKATLGEPWFIRIGINLGPLKMVRDINSHTNMIGDGVNDAQRVMSFAEPGQVMVSHSYYDIVSRFSRDYTKMFVYEGMRHDKHVREHELYRFGPAEGTENLSEQLTEKIRDRSRTRPPEEPFIDFPEIFGSVATRQKISISGLTRHWMMPRIRTIAPIFAVLAVTGAAWALAGKSISEIPSETLSAAVAADRQTMAAVPVQAELKQVVLDTTGNNVGQMTPRFAPLPEVTPPGKPGTVKLAVQPWGEIYVNGVMRGVTPPMKSLNLEPGKHRIEVRNGKFTPYRQTVEVKSSSETTIRYVF